MAKKSTKIDGAIYITTVPDPEDDPDFINNLPDGLAKRYALKYLQEKKKRKKTKIKKQNYYFDYGFSDILESMRDISDAFFRLYHKKIPPLTKEREPEYRRLVDEGSSITQIAHTMIVSAETVKKDLRHLNIKLRNRKKTLH